MLSVIKEIRCILFRSRIFLSRLEREFSCTGFFASGGHPFPAPPGQLADRELEVVSLARTYAGELLRTDMIHGTRHFQHYVLRG